MNRFGYLPQAIFISMTLHTLFVVGSYWMKLPELGKARQHQVEISYRRPKPPVVDIKQHPIKPSQKLDLENSLLSTTNGSVGVKLANSTDAMKNLTMYERKPAQIKSLQVSRINVRPITSEKINNPIYTTYQDRVRSQINERALANFLAGFQEKGIVYLTFIISSDGNLKDYRIVDEKTSATQNLRMISITSLKEARFPPFNKGLTLPEYSFNVEIDYQVN